MLDTLPALSCDPKSQPGLLITTIAQEEEGGHGHFESAADVKFHAVRGEWWNVVGVRRVQPFVLDVQSMSVGVCPTQVSLVVLVPEGDNRVLGMPTENSVALMEIQVSVGETGSGSSGLHPDVAAATAAIQSTENSGLREARESFIGQCAIGTTAQYSWGLFVEGARVSEVPSVALICKVHSDPGAALLKSTSAKSPILFVAARKSGPL